MKPTVEDLNEIIEILNEAEAIRPLVKGVITVLKSFSSELKDIPESISSWVVANRVRAIKQYEAAGFTRDDAILMTLDDMQRLQKGLEKVDHAVKQLGKNPIGKDD